MHEQPPWSGALAGEIITTLARQDERVVALMAGRPEMNEWCPVGRCFPNVRSIDPPPQWPQSVVEALEAGQIPFLMGWGDVILSGGLEWLRRAAGVGRPNVKIVAWGGGLAAGQRPGCPPLLEDLAFLRPLQDVTVAVPSDRPSLRALLEGAYKIHGTVWIRVEELPDKAVFAPDQRFPLGRAVRLTEGLDVTIAALGTCVGAARQAVDILLTRGWHARLLAFPTLQPLDREAIEAAAVETGAIVTVEEHVLRGGLGSAVAEAVVSLQPVPILSLGFGGLPWAGMVPAEVRRANGLTPEAIAAAAQAVHTQRQWQKSS